MYVPYVYTTSHLREVISSKTNREGITNPVAALFNCFALSMAVLFCQELTVSCKELDTLVEAARSAGAIGAKMSGTGRGGLMLALTPGKETQDAVALALSNAGAAQVWKTSFA